MTIAILGLILLSWLFLILGLLIWLRIGQPILFQQKRPGKNGKIFCLCKFRTMLPERDAEGQVLSEQKRLTSFGNWLRSTSLDELPELWNVLKGDMSLVGPRPLLEEYLNTYTKMQAKRHDVLPGITGWAQINGRNTISWEKKFELDLWYIENASMLLDVKILFLTIWQVILRKGINNVHHTTMGKFGGDR